MRLRYLFGDCRSLAILSSYGDGRAASATERCSKSGGGIAVDSGPQQQLPLELANSWRRLSATLVTTTTATWSYDDDDEDDYDDCHRERPAALSLRLWQGLASPSRDRAAASRSTSTKAGRRRATAAASRLGRP